MKETTMNQFSFRPRLETLDGRCLPSANAAISISDVALSEGDSGQTAFDFTVSLSEASSKTVSVKYATANGTATTGDNDYVATSGTLKFAPGETTKTITVLVNGDAKAEADEHFFVNLSRARNATLADVRGVGTVFDDDDFTVPPPPSDGMAIDPYSGLPYISTPTDDWWT
jgi:hypothetical protein